LWRGRRCDLACSRRLDGHRVDISEVALGRAREATDLAGDAVDWICGDALQVSLPTRTFDLVSMQYPALSKAAGEVAVGRLLDTVQPGGLLLAIYHDLDDEHREHMMSRGVDPADYVDADDLAQLLGDDFTVELRAVEPRIDPPPDNPHIADVVLRARRRR
jgi:SAM-dependent methyltransferase